MVENVRSKEICGVGSVQPSVQKPQPCNRDLRQRDWRDTTILTADVWQDKCDRLKPVPGKIHESTGIVSEEPKAVVEHPWLTGGNGGRIPPGTWRRGSSTQTVSGGNEGSRASQGN